MIWEERKQELQLVHQQTHHKLHAAYVCKLFSQFHFMCSANDKFLLNISTVTKTCGGFTQTNNTYFVNTNYPGTFGGGSRCNMRVKRMGTDVCQLKISFLDMALAPPTGGDFFH